MRPLELVTRDPLLKLTALVLAFLLWALVETGGRAPEPPAARSRADSAQAPAEPPTDSKAVPVAVRVIGQLPAGWELAGPLTVEPPTVTLSGPLAALERVDSVRLPAIRLDGRTSSLTVDVPIDTVGLGLGVAPRVVRVTIPIRQIPTDSSGGGAAERPDPAPAPAGALP